MSSQAYVVADGTQWPVQCLDEYRTVRGEHIAVVLIAGYPGVCQYRTLAVPTADVVVRPC